MLDVGWTEILVIAIVLILVVGPKDLPPMLRTFGRMVTKMRGMASDFRQQFDEALREADLDDVRKTIGDAQKLNPLNTIRDAVNPLRQVGDEIKSDLQKSVNSSTSSVSTPVSAVSAVPSEANKPASAEPVAAEPLKKGPTRKTAAKKAEPATASTEKAARKLAAKAKAEPKAVAVKPAAKASSAKNTVAAKTSTAKAKTAKTRKDEA
ncbi:Sec-independent protein translocase protein TatB [Shinella sumterensis]|jgi:sec-independent protein translocase protein TatB|uniref:Sec-independent protein translocase protein TatB n=1 Tax=Shinella sumterensis TaxID=1967501 RepID=A0AA50CMR3_9HYPH|nr:Sec-independent protein translocase protein TatB [Shinella sumterensis]MCD1264714.1 twin-arginine translocase subunit TatB [Shinella sumterensis]TFE98348.1 twin arginine-targeting protein translocase TatB [Shinella sumterensis]WLR98843.1 Sec-independent protein translocase protein TatB [Shinella sumterensis]